jgi:hypothetical protein
MNCYARLALRKMNVSDALMGVLILILYVLTSIISFVFLQAIGAIIYSIFFKNRGKKRLDFRAQISVVIVFLSIISGYMGEFLSTKHIPDLWIPLPGISAEIVKWVITCNIFWGWSTFIMLGVIWLDKHNPFEQKRTILK